MDLNLVHIIIRVSSYDQTSLISHIYDAVRRFETCFKSVCCMQNNLSCHLCGEQSERCPYRSVFGQLLSSDPYIVRMHQKPPLPFAFKISEIEHVSSCIEIGIVIVGDAIQHVSIFLNAISQMVVSVGVNNGVDVTVSGAWSLDYQGGRHEFNLSPHSLVFLSGLEILQASQHSNSVIIYLESPLRLLCDGSISHAFDFGLLLRSQLRRCSSFFAYYGGGELDLDYVFLSKISEKVTAIDSSFSFKIPLWSKRAGFSGILGAGEFTGLDDGLMPILMLGSYLNAGKGATYGMGAYRIEGV